MLALEILEPLMNMCNSPHIYTQFHPVLFSFNRKTQNETLGNIFKLLFNTTKRCTVWITFHVHQRSLTSPFRFHRRTNTSSTRVRKTLEWV